MKVAHHISVVLLSAIILLQSGSMLLVNAGYNVNRSYIASALCVNRSKPEMHCDGKCFLKKQLSNQQEKESSQKTVQPNSSVLLFCEEISSYNFYQSNRNLINFSPDLFLSSGFMITAERPPTC